MSDIIQRINEATNYKILRNLKWEEIMYSFFSLYDSAKGMTHNDKNKKAQAAFQNASTMCDNLQKFIDSYPVQEKLNDDARKEADKIMKANRQY